MKTPTRRDPPDDGRLVFRRELADATGIARALRRIAAEIVERGGGSENLMLVGVHRGGVPLARRIARYLGELEGTAPPVGAIDITLYRDDVFEGLPKPEIGPTELPLSVPGRRIVLVDDVLYTGRTVRAALDVIMDYGRPRSVELAVLVDRGWRELPISADYVGLTVTTTRAESVQVKLDELDGSDQVLLRAKADPAPAPPSPSQGG